MIYDVGNIAFSAQRTLLSWKYITVRTFITLVTDVVLQYIPNNVFLMTIFQVNLSYRNAILVRKY